MFVVYMHVSPSNKRYIGITSKKPEHRWNYGKSYSSNKHFSSAIKKYGWDSFEHIIVYSGLSKQDACKKEKELIALYNSNNPQYGYNNSIGGENPAEGAIFSEESRRKMSNAHKGLKHSKETKELLSKKKKGMPNGHEGKLGKMCGKAGIVSQIDEATGKIVAVFYGYSEMQRITGYAKTPVRETAQGIRKRAYGYKWKYEKRGLNNVFI